MIERHALIESSSGIVKNIIQLDTAFTYAPPTGQFIVLLVDQPVSIGDHYNKLTAVFTEAKPSPDYVLSGKTWVLSLPVVKSRMVLEMSLACKTVIESGFVSAALAAGTTYPSTTTDQLNLSGRVSESLVQNANAAWTGSVMCKDAVGAWARRQHSHAQIRQVGLDAVAWVAVQLDKLDQRRSAIAAATTVDDVKAIFWS